MKKIFTLAAAMLFTASMMAQTTVFNWSPTAEECVGTIVFGTTDFSVSTVKIHENKDEITALKLNTGYKYADKKYMYIKPAKGSFKAGDIVSLSVCFNNSDVTKVAIVDIYAPDGTTKLYTTPQGLNGRNAGELEIVTYTLENDADSLILARGGNTATYIPTLYVTNPAPVADPVTTVTISGKNECYTGKTITLIATTDVKADNYQWFVNDVAQNEAINKSFDFTPAADGNYNIVCKAKNNNNTDWVASTPFVVTATTKVMQDDLVAVNNDITWDFANIEVANVAPDTEVENDTLIFANLYAEWATGFAADKIAGKGQYFYYASNQCFQGHVLKFVTTVPGKVVVEYSNTGGDRPYRHVRVNGVLSAAGSASTTKITSEEFAVKEGEVLIDFYIPDATQPKAKEGQGVGVQMARVYKVVFTKTEATGFENVGINGKAVKVIRDGQVLILRDGKMFNALGVEVK